MKELKQIPIDEIRVDGGTQMREEIDEATVADYAERTDELPPSIVFFDGVHNWLADGFHRLHAYNRAGKKKLLCEVRKGTQRDAILFAAGANHSHGLRRSNADKRKAVLVLLKDEEWGKRSATWIAEQCQVGVSMVADMKRALCAAHSAPVETKDGRRMNTSGISESNSARKKNKDDGDPDEFFPAEKKNGKHHGTPREAENPKSVKDEAGQEITNPKIVELYQRRQEITDLMTQVSQIKSRVEKACNASDPLFVHLTFSQFKADCNNAYRALRFARPHALCPYCGGRGKCKVCGDTGLVGETQFKNYTPEDLKV